VAVALGFSCGEVLPVPSIQERLPTEVAWPSASCMRLRKSPRQGAQEGKLFCLSSSTKRSCARLAGIVTWTKAWQGVGVGIVSDMESTLPDNRGMTRKKGRRLLSIQNQIMSQIKSVYILPGCE
jgi:hypothetical protein